jgi:hypothetical protein
MKEKFEYKVLRTLHRTARDTERILNELGSQGWRVCASYGSGEIILERRIG